MNKELSELAMIRLQTELENAIGFRDYYLKQENHLQYHVWDVEVENILDTIRTLGEL